MVRTNRLVRRGEELTSRLRLGRARISLEITGRSPALEPDSESHHRCWLLAESYREADRLKEAAQAYAMRAAMSADEEALVRPGAGGAVPAHDGGRGRFCTPGVGRLRSAPATGRNRSHDPGALLPRARHERGQHPLLRMPGWLCRGRARTPSSSKISSIQRAQRRVRTRRLLCARTRAPRRGAEVCNWLALARAVPSGSRAVWRARTCISTPEPAGTIMPSLAACPVGFAAPEGYRLANPSVALQWWADRLVATGCRAVATRRGRGTFCCNWRKTWRSNPRWRSWRRPRRRKRGFQDPRLFAWRDGLWCCARTLTPAAEESASSCWRAWMAAVQVRSG